MATVTEKDATVTLSKKQKLPPNTRVMMRCISEENVISKNTDSPMIKQSWEIVTEKITDPVTGKDIALAGVSIDKNFMIKILDNKVMDEAKTKKSRGFLHAYWDSIGRDEIKKGWDDENPPLVSKGIVVDAIISSKEFTPTEKASPEEIAAGKVYGDKAVLGEDGKPVVLYTPQIDYILGLSKNPPSA